MASPELSGDTFFTASLNESKLGLKFNGEEITSITDGGWAHRAGVEVDDEIVTVAGKDFKTLSHKERVALLVEGKRPLEIKFKRPVFKDVYYTCSLSERKIGMTMKGKYVKTVDAAGWAGKNGVMIGDEIAELGTEGYAGLTDEERLKIFSGPRPLTIRFVRRNQKTAYALSQEKKTGDLNSFLKINANLADGTAGVDVTKEGLTAAELQKGAQFETTGARGGGFCFCCQSTADKANEFKVTG